MTSSAAGDEAWIDDAAPADGAPGWLRKLLLALWLPLLLVAAAAPVAGPILLEMKDIPADRGAPFMRVGLFPTTTNIKPISDEARKAGFQAGDVIVAVDGKPLSGGGTSVMTDELVQQLVGPVGAAVRLTTRSPDGATHELRLTRSDAHNQALAAAGGLSPSALDRLFYFAYIAVNSLVIAAAVLLFVKGGGRTVPMLLAFGLPILGLTFCGMSLIVALEQGWLVLPIRVVNWSMMILALMLFPNGAFHPRWMRWVGVLMVVVTPIGVIGMANEHLPIAIWIPFHTIFLLAGVSSLVARYRSLPTGEERQQIRWAMFGFSLAVALLVAVLVDEVLVQPLTLPPAADLWSTVIDYVMQLLMVLAFAGGLFVSLLRYRLYDADRVIARSASFGALALALIALFAGTEKVIELLGEEVFGEQLGVLAGGIGAALAAATIVPLHHRLNHWAEHRFQKQLIQLRRGLPALVGDLRETAPVERIAAASLDWVVRGVRASRAALVMGSKVVDARGVEADAVDDWRKGWIPSLEPGLDSAREDALFPLRIPLEADGHGRVGWLLLGPRPDGSFYGKDERKALEEIADPVARALEIAEAREAREAAERERWAGQETINAELMRVLGALDEKLGRLLPKGT